MRKKLKDVNFKVGDTVTCTWPGAAGKFKIVKIFKDSTYSPRSVTLDREWDPTYPISQALNIGYVNKTLPSLNDRLREVKES